MRMTPDSSSYPLTEPAELLLSPWRFVFARTFCVFCLVSVHARLAVQAVEFGTGRRCVQRCAARGVKRAARRVSRHDLASAPCCLYLFLSLQRFVFGPLSYPLLFFAVSHVVSSRCPARERAPANCIQPGLRVRKSSWSDQRGHVDTLEWRVCTDVTSPRAFIVYYVQPSPALLRPITCKHASVMHALAFSRLSDLLTR